MDNLQGLVPEIYYDMIARIASGVLLVAILVSPQVNSLDKYSNVASFILLIGVGYIAGHVLTAISIGLNLLFWNKWLLDRFLRKVQLFYGFSPVTTFRIFDVAYQRIDWAARKDANAGAIMKKMEAGAALSDNLLSGWIVIVLYYFLGGKIGWAINLGWWNWPILVLVTAVLIISIYVRRIAFIVRQDRIIYQIDNPAATAGVPK